jgi:hypothetical protein
MMTRLYHTPQTACGGALNSQSDPLADRRQGTQYTAVNEEKYNEKSRQEPYRWLGSDNADAEPGLRGQLQ